MITEICTKDAGGSSSSSSSSLFNDESVPSGLFIVSLRQVMGTWQEDTAPLRFKRADAIGCSK